MRSVKSISLPPEMIKAIKIATKKDGFATFSEFMRHLIRLWHEEKLYQDVMESEEDYKTGQFKTLNSIAELDREEF